jgi:adenylate kinase
LKLPIEKGLPVATYVVLLGPPGAGKGSQAKRVVKETALPHVSTGDLLRGLKSQDTPLARRVLAIMAEGGLVDDETTMAILKERLLEPDSCDRGAILDGVPRTLAQAKMLERMLAKEFSATVDAVFLLSISEDEAVRRISGRRVNPDTGRVYHVEFDPPKVEGVGDETGTPLIQREDDKPAVVRERYQLYLEKTAPLIDYYRAAGRLHEIDAARPIDAITPDLLDAIEALRSK